MKQKTDTSEKGLEALIVRSLTGPAYPPDQLHDPALPYGRPSYTEGDPRDYDRAHAVDLAQLLAFLETTQPKFFETIATPGPSRDKFLDRLQGEITKHGIIQVLRKGIDHGPHHIDLFYGSPTPGNAKARERFLANRFSVTRQLRYSKDESRLALDLCLFINGLPIATFELKNSLTKQTVQDAVEQYKRDRDSRELLFQFGRCIVHFAVDDSEVYFCTHLKDKASWFLPFNKGYNDGAGNPPNPDGIKTDYLWREILTPEGLTEIIENYAQIITEQDRKTGKKTKKQIFPRYHQLSVVRALLGDAEANGPGKRYLIQHSAGSGKSNSITWLAHQLVDLKRDGKPVFDSIIVVTDRRNLDKQIKENIKQFTQVDSVFGHAERSGDLRRFLTAGKKIIITTVQKFPFIMAEIGDQHRGRNFAIIIDEAHSSQSGRTAAQMNMVLAEEGAEEEESTEDIINRLMETRKMLPNASYFAFTATPKNKTLEVFGVPYPEGGETKYRPFHVYTMKQAIQERFIMDVLAHYTSVDSYYRLVQTVQDDPEFDVKNAQKKLAKYVQSHDHAIRKKAEIMVDHFHEQVLTKHKIGGRARAMVITNGIERAIQYYEAISAYLKERKSPYKAIVAFSGEHEYAGKKETEATLNGFASNQIESTFRDDDAYRFLICADKFQTGYDEPLLHTMYVDKTLSDIKAVQTLSRLNRAHPQKHDTFILDFMNDPEEIRAAFERYYRTTLLAKETDPNKLHDLKSDLDGFQVYSGSQIEMFVDLYVTGADREKLDPILDKCVEVYLSDSLDEDGRVDFKGKAKAFLRTYSFLAAILPFSNAGWEKLSLFLNFLVPKLPAPKEEDLAKGILESIDMDSYRVEVQKAIEITLADQDAEIDPVPTSGGGQTRDPQMERLSTIIQSFNERWGTDFKDSDRIRRVITEELPEKLKANKAYQNAMKNSDRQNARIEHDKALLSVLWDYFADSSDFFKRASDDAQFRQFVSDSTFALTYSPPGA